ncbi:MAG: hypothetical protein SWC40_01595, partial [Thermodesulfobacteriota bacterium]|nr:hypothetical protein [Thermodesulfobacteriota bacterium]
DSGLRKARSSQDRIVVLPKEKTRDEPCHPPTLENTDRQAENNNKKAEHADGNVHLIAGADPPSVRFR